MQRRLAAILAADLVGYTRLMSRDEAATLQRLSTLRESLLRPLIERHRGRLVKLMGDGLLLEFASLVDAVDCALAWQAAVAAQGAGESDDRRLAFRIGIHLGDVMVEGDDIYGDGVNLASRLEGLAEPGGICLSGDAFRQVRGKVAADFEDLGEQTVKNVAEPLQVYRCRPPGSPAPATGSGSPLPLPARAPALPDKPSLAVLPFDNMSADPDQSFFADGMTEDLITDLSRMPWFFVIARNTSFTYKDRAIDVAQVARELGVRYVLEGSVRKSGNRLRITAQLIDGESGQHVWASRYDREIHDIFDVQDEVTQAIVGAIAPEFLAIEAKRARRKDQEALDVWECLMRGRAHLWKLSKDDCAAAKALLQRALALDPGGARAAADLALVYFLETYYGWSADPEASRASMVAAAEQAVANDDSDPWALTILSWANIFARKWEAALPPVARAVEISPNFATAIGLRGAIQALLGDAEACIADVARAQRLSPHDGMAVFWIMGVYWAYHETGRYAEAEAAARQGLRLAPDNPTFRRQLAAALYWQGREEEARAAVADYLRIAPHHTTADAGKVPCRDPAPVEKFVEGLRRAGLPDAKEN